MTNELYATGCVIANGLPDHEDDILDKSSIKRIFTKYINRETDTMHTRIRNEGVDVLANWISETDITIAGKTAPAGSWLATFKITNPEIIKSIQDGDITGVSLGSVSDTAMTQEFWFINKSINYKDLDSIEEVIPLFISFVDKPSNMFGLEIMDYNVYINKSISVDNMTEQEVIDKINEDKVSISTIEKIKDLFIAKSEEEEEIETNEEEVEKAEEAPEENTDITNAELLEKIPEAVTTAIIDAFTEMGWNEETVTEEVEVEKAEEEEKPEEEEVEINKRATVKIDDMETKTNTGNFYEKSGRDARGCRL